MVGAPARDPFRTPAGLLVFPFVVGVALTLAVAAGMRQPITVVWVLMGVAVGTIAAAIMFATKLAERHPAQTAHTAAAGARRRSDAALVRSGQEAAPPQADAATVDPLGHIHAVEEQGRRHRRACINCGTMVKATSEACSNCGHRTTYPCKGCQTQIRLDWTNCPECGRSVP